MGGGGQSTSAHSESSMNDASAYRTASRTPTTNTNRGPSGELGFIR
jgi:hypothetical protein